MMPTAYIPGQRYPAVSITGTRCSLMCDYCRAYYLKGMYSVSSPHELYKLANKLYEKGARGLLISGGFNSRGELPIRPFLPTIREIKRDFNMIISVHSGLVSKETARSLGDAGIDVVDYELLTDRVVIRDVMHLRRKEDDFLKGLKWLMEEGPPYVAPHIPIGFHYGRITMEREALEEVSALKPYILIFIVFRPTKGTPMESIPPPPVEDVVKLLQSARKEFGGEIALGCMRPPEYKSSLDEIVIERGLVDRIAVPRWQVVRKYGMREVRACCSIPKDLMSLFDEGPEMEVA